MSLYVYEIGVRIIVYVRKGSVSDTMNPEQPIWIAEILKLVNGASFDSGWK